MNFKWNVVHLWYKKYIWQAQCQLVAYTDHRNTLNELKTSPSCENTKRMNKVMQLVTQIQCYVSMLAKGMFAVMEYSIYRQNSEQRTCPD